MTEQAMSPLPASVAVELTATPALLRIEPFTTRVPALMVVRPV